MKFINMLSMHVQPGTHRRFNLLQNDYGFKQSPTILMFVDLIGAPKL